MNLGNNQLTGLPADIGQLTSLVELRLGENRLTSLPAEIWQLTSLTELVLDGNQLTSLPAEIGQLTSLERLTLGNNQLTSLPAEIGQLTLWRVGPRQQFPDEPAGGDWAAHIAEGVEPQRQLVDIVPANIEQLASLTELDLGNNQLRACRRRSGSLRR